MSTIYSVYPGFLGEAQSTEAGQWVTVILQSTLHRDSLSGVHPASPNASPRAPFKLAVGVAPLPQRRMGKVGTANDGIGDSVQATSTQYRGDCDALVIVLRWIADRCLLAQASGALGNGFWMVIAVLSMLVIGIGASRRCPVRLLLSCRRGRRRMVGGRLRNG